MEQNLSKPVGPIDFYPKLAYKGRPRSNSPGRVPQQVGPVGRQRQQRPAEASAGGEDRQRAEEAAGQRVAPGPRQELRGGSEG